MAWLEFQAAAGGSILRRQLFTANGTWTKPDKLVGDQVFITAIGGGSSGNSDVQELSGTSGAFIVRLSVDVSGTASETVTIGAGGASVTGAVGNAGAVTSFGSLVSVDGGVAPGTPEYLSPLIGQNPGTGAADSQGQQSIKAITGVFGAPVSFSLVGNLGGSGLLLDTSGTKAEDQASTTDGVGGIGYGAGGCSDADGTTGSTAGAPGAVLVEWLEKV